MSGKWGILSFHEYPPPSSLFGCFTSCLVAMWWHLLWARDSMKLMPSGLKEVTGLKHWLLSSSVLALLFANLFQSWFGLAMLIHVLIFTCSLWSPCWSRVVTQIPRRFPGLLSTPSCLFKLNVMLLVVESSGGWGRLTLRNYSTVPVRLMQVLSIFKWQIDEKQCSGLVKCWCRIEDAY